MYGDPYGASDSPFDDGFDAYGPMTGAEYAAAYEAGVCPECHSTADAEGRCTGGEGQCSRWRPAPEHDYEADECGLCQDPSPGQLGHPHTAPWPRSCPATLADLVPADLGSRASWQDVAEYRGLVAELMARDGLSEYDADGLLWGDGDYLDNAWRLGLSNAAPLQREEVG